MRLFLLLALACRPSPPPTVPAADLALPGPPTWPERNAPLTPLELAIPEDFGVRRVAIDPGHGTPTNRGSRTSLCTDEAEVMLDLAVDLAERLRATGTFEVLLTREEADGPSYRARADAAAHWGAEVLISLHLDARGTAWSWAHPDGPCLRNDRIPGYSVLVADRDGDSALIDARLRLARSLSAALRASGFGAYRHGYGDLYDPDPMPGVYLDRRVLFMLRRPAMPSVILETHHGLDLAEHRRWAQPATREAFAAAVAVALVEALSTRAP